MTGSRSPIYERRGNTEDILALLGSAQERQKAILIHALQETHDGYRCIFDEAAAMADELLQARRIVQRHWCSIQALIDAEE